MNNNKGFTLIETLVATFIFSLVAIAYIQYLNTSIRVSHNLLAKKQAALVADNVMVQLKLCINVPKTNIVELNGNKYMYKVEEEIHSKLKSKKWVKISVYDDIKKSDKKLVGVLSHMTNINDCKVM